MKTANPRHNPPAGRCKRPSCSRFGEARPKTGARADAGDKSRPAPHSTRLGRRGTVRLDRNEAATVKPRFGHARPRRVHAATAGQAVAPLHLNPCPPWTLAPLPAARRPPAATRPWKGHKSDSAHKPLPHTLTAHENAEKSTLRSPEGHFGGEGDNRGRGGEWVGAQEPDASGPARKDQSRCGFNACSGATRIATR